MWTRSSFALISAAVICAGCPSKDQASGRATKKTGASKPAPMQEMEITSCDHTKLRPAAWYDCWVTITKHAIPKEVGLNAKSAPGTADERKWNLHQNKLIKIQVKDGVWLNDAKVVKADIEAKNGLIHVIDTVLIPADL